MPGVELEPEVRAAFEDASRLLAEPRPRGRGRAAPGLLGPDVLPSFERVWALSGTTLPVPPDRVGELRPLTRELRGARAGAVGAGRDGGDARAPAVLPAVPAGDRAATTSCSRRSCTMTPRPLGWFDADGDGAEDFERQKRYAAFTALFNVTGQPAVSVPLYWTDGRAADRDHARRAPGGRGDAARAVGAGGGGAPVGAPAPRRDGSYSSVIAGGCR